MSQSLGLFSGIGQMRRLIEMISQLKRWIDLDQLPPAITAIRKAIENDASIDTKEGLKSHVELWLQALSAIAKATTTEKDDTAVAAIEHLIANLDWLMPIIADFLKNRKEVDDQRITLSKSTGQSFWNADVLTLLQLLRMVLQLIGLKKL